MFNYIWEKIILFFLNNNEKLINAINNENLNKVKSLVDRGADVNYITSDGLNMLILAIRKNNLALVKYLIENGANINHVSQYGNTPLILVTKENHSDVFI